MKTKLIPNDDLFDLAFDQFSRQFIVKNLIESLREKSQSRFSILDVGGHKGKTRDFFPKDHVTIVDLFDVEEEGYIQASGLDLPFRDASYDFVLSFDVFEHIAAPDRKRFLEEADRIAKVGIFIAAPFNEGLVSDTEKMLNSYYARLNKGEDHRWLMEHIENGLPTASVIKEFVESKHLSCVELPSNNLLLWSGLQHLIFIADSIKAPERLLHLNRFYNQHLSEVGDFERPSYRKVFYLSKDKRMPKRLALPKYSFKKNLELNNHIASAIDEIIFSKTQELRHQTQMIASKDHEIEILNDRLSSILESRAWKIASGIQKIHRYFKRIR